MSKSKSVYKTNLHQFDRKTSLDTKNIQGLNPQIFTIQAQSFINQNFFHNNASEFFHDKSNNFISNLRKLSQKKLKSERICPEIKKFNNKSANSLIGSNIIEAFPRKPNLKLNISAQNKNPFKIETKIENIQKSQKHFNLKQMEIILEKSINMSILGTNPTKELSDCFKNLSLESPDNSNLGFQILKVAFEKCLEIISKNSNELKDLKEKFFKAENSKENEIYHYQCEMTELNKTIETQVQQIEMLQAKEKQLIQFLLAVKSRGVIDLESIFNEEFNKISEDPKIISNSLQKTTKSKSKTIIISNSVNEISQEADISIVNDSEESSFNYFGKNEISGFIFTQPVAKISPPKKKAFGLPGKLKLNLNSIQKESPENCEENEEILSSEKSKNKKEDDMFKKKKPAGKIAGINEEMKENLMEKLRNFRKVYEKLAKN